MYVLGVYDINVKRVAKVKKIFSRYMFWMQNSTFEGNLTKVQLRELQRELNSVVNPNEDHIIFYVIRNEDVVTKTIIGERHSEPSNIL
ncbi:CRISPR-associated endonuclease Cas2 [Paenactinomyces guangxiensis]|uniref:CRISPR-associated endoribonuclease Cas2 n=1 Tax=Paenactinomyces guangxiensis TaxID=1490290 RepID=A0A7W1WNV6_9BACL|nr:CRISPR-associated endonuclease Cas2 [Paenactinomyces guangxiensis]MBA4493256.1 CRISPR-associated endonuclease Cas2 [Paenactinomyces guangxiensis]MBH8589893.1 CRISPR-associated endonuclease Cas2 [Paenactinomyces guangxiensis]